MKKLVNVLSDHNSSISFLHGTSLLALAFAHPDFARDNPSGLSNIRRKGVNTSNNL